MGVYRVKALVRSSSVIEYHLNFNTLPSTLTSLMKHKVPPRMTGLLIATWIAFTTSAIALGVFFFLLNYFLKSSVVLLDDHLTRVISFFKFY